SSRRRHTRWPRDWSSDVCSSDLVNNAGIAGKNATTWDYPAEEWAQVMRVNLDGPFHCCRAVAPGMIAQNYGRIVNIASVAGKEEIGRASCRERGEVWGWGRS